MIVFIEHHENPRDDRAWTHLGDRGFERKLVCPFRGEKLDPPGPEVEGVVIYGGGQNVGEQSEHPFLRDEIQWIEQCLGRGLPMLGLCLGGQLLAHTLGAPIKRRSPRECEFGYYPLTTTEAGDGWLPEGFHATQAHYEEFSIPHSAVHLAASDRFPHQAFCHAGNVYGLQFHPEIHSKIFRRWQDEDWAMFDIPGSQQRAQQDQLMARHDERQGEWFYGFLDELFSNPAGG